MDVIVVDGVRRFKRNGKEFISTYDVGISNPRLLETYFVEWVDSDNESNPYGGYRLGFASAKEIAEVYPNALRQKAKSKEQAKNEPDSYEDLADANAYLLKEVKRLHEKVFELEALLEKKKESR
jgi:hypothetical protein